MGPCPNNYLNYGYTLLRSAMARAIMDAGQHCLPRLTHCLAFMKTMDKQCII